MKNLIHYFLLATIFLYLSCGKDNQVKIKTDLSGNIQKGPYITGSRITIQELDDELIPTGIVFETNTIDDKGSFEIPVKLNSEYVEIIASGFYFNENTGKLSDANLTLRSLVNLSEGNKTNVNILTTLTNERVRYLLQDESMNFDEAKKQAENEVLNIFKITATDIDGFENLSICESGNNNGILLAISILLQEGNTTAELSYLANKISIDLKEDGVLSDLTLLKEIIQNSIDLKLPQIRRNIEQLYGDEYIIPTFEKHAQQLIYPDIESGSIDIESDLYFHFSPNEGNIDLSGNNNIIELINCGVTKDQNDSTSSAYSISRANKSYIQLPAGLNLWEPNWTYSIWAKMDQIGAWNEVSLLANKSTEPGISDFEDVYLAINENYASDPQTFATVGVFVDDYFKSSGYNINRSEWYHYAVSYEEGIIKIYINGSLMAVLQEDFNFEYAENSPFEIAKRNRRGVEFDGAVNDIRFYKRALNIAEVNYLFENKL